MGLTRASPRLVLLEAVSFIQPILCSRLTEEALLAPKLDGQRAYVHVAGRPRSVP
jgi:hypothetical protein